MHPSSPDASPALPAIVLALALLGVFAAVGGQVLIQMRMAPGTLLPAGAEAAVASPNNARTPAQPGAIAVPQVETGPGWETLTTPQKLALYPLAERWALISEAQKRRWLALAATFSSLPEDEQAKFHDRMTDWASLSAQQRNQARLNYAVTTKTSAAEALKLFRADPMAFDLVITDLTMPGMTGVDVAAQVLLARPGMPLILATGFNANWTLDALRKLGIHDLVMKPLSLATLSTRMRSALA